MLMLNVDSFYFFNDVEFSECQNTQTEQSSLLSEGGWLVTEVTGESRVYFTDIGTVEVPTGAENYPIHHLSSIRAC